MIMSCDRGGTITISEVMPKGNLPIARGNQKELTTHMQGKARLAYDNRTYLVPGIPEAKDSDEAMTALWRFIDFVGLL